MAVFAIGDVQGCYDELRTLLERIRFDPVQDRLWFAGDLVNRGPRSLEVLRFVRELGPAAISVLGNHDLHLVAVAAGVRRPRPEDTIDGVLAAPDGEQLVDWLRHRPLLHHDPGLGFTLVHAGLPPEWNSKTAARHAAELEAVLRGPDHASWLKRLQGDAPDRWADGLEPADRLRFVANCLLRMRYCTPDGRIDVDCSDPPGAQRQGLLPWFEVPHRRSRGERILFGHWATLQLHRPVDPAHGVYHLDAGCAWGGRLCALRLDDESYFSVPCRA